MRNQVHRTLTSLSPNYQKTINQHVKVCLIDNASECQVDNIDKKSLKPWAFEYIKNNDKSIPIHHEINKRINRSREKIIGIMIDGARLCSDNIIQQASNIISTNPLNVVSIPNYQLGPCMQMRNNDAQSDEFNEKLLKSINWPECTTKELLDISYLEPHAGIKAPLFETNFLFMSRYLWENVGGYETEFTSKDGGFASADLFSRLVNNEECNLYILRNEGTFHQFHNGTTTNQAESTAIAIKQMTREYIKIRKKPFSLYRGKINYYPPLDCLTSNRCTGSTPVKTNNCEKA
jgi:hypothetical protein